MAKPCDAITGLFLLPESPGLELCTITNSNPHKWVSEVEASTIINVYIILKVRI